MNEDMTQLRPQKKPWFEVLAIVYRCYPPMICASTDTRSTAESSREGGEEKSEQLSVLAGTDSSGTWLQCTCRWKEKIAASRGKNTS